MTGRLALAFAVAASLTAATAGTAAAQDRAARPPAALRCIYDGVSAGQLDQVGAAFWTMDPSAPQPGQVLAGQARICARRHNWGPPELAQAARYTMGAASVRYVHARMAALGLSAEPWEALYRTVPVEERTDPGSALMQERVTRAVAADAEALRRDPEIVAHAATFFAMRAMAERAERWWAGLPGGD